MIESNKIYCMDYLDLMRHLPDNSIDLILTDPPFGINYQNNYTKNKYEVLTGDVDKFSYKALAVESYRVLKDNSAIFVFTGWSEYPNHYKEIESAGFSMKEPLICQKRPSGKTDLYGSFQSNSDWLIFAHKGRFTFRQTKLLRNKKAGVVPNRGRKPVPLYKTRFPSCWFGEEFPYSTENSSFQKKNNIFHPTIKGETFVKWLILLSTNDKDVVLDPFVGSGTTAIACQMMNRNFICGDINPEFCKLAEKRVNN